MIYLPLSFFAGLLAPPDLPSSLPISFLLHMFIIDSPRSFLPLRLYLIAACLCVFATVPGVLYLRLSVDLK